jgi:hypothetical protein
MNKNQVVSYIKPMNYFKLLEFCNKRGLKTLSEGIDNVLETFFSGLDEQKLATDRLNSVIQKQQMEIQQLRHDITHSVNKEIQDLKNAEVIK